MELAAILGFLLLLGYVAMRLTHWSHRHNRLHPRGLNSDPNTAPSIIATGGDAGCADGGCGDGGGGGD